MFPVDEFAPCDVREEEPSLTRPGAPVYSELACARCGLTLIPEDEGFCPSCGSMEVVEV